jgi:hypothetical protein
VLECDSRRGFGLDIGLIDHFNAQLIITLNYNAIANFHILQFTRAHSKSFAAHSVFTSNCLVTAPNNGYSSPSGFKSFLKGGSLPTELFFKSQSFVTTDGQSANWGLRPDLYYCQTVADLLMWGALSDERTGLSCARVTVSSNKSLVSMYNLHFTCY